MTALILLLAVAALSGAPVPVVPRVMRRQRRRAARREFQRRIDVMAYQFEQMAVAIGEALLPAIRNVAAAFSGLGAVLMKDPSLAALARAHAADTTEPPKEQP